MCQFDLDVDVPIHTSTLQIQCSGHLLLFLFCFRLKCRMEHVTQDPQMMPTITRLRPGSPPEVICPSKADMAGTYFPKLFAEDSVVVSGSLMWKRYLPVLHSECLMLMGTKHRERQSLNFGSTFWVATLLNNRCLAERRLLLGSVAATVCVWLRILFEDYMLELDKAGVQMFGPGREAVDESDSMAIVFGTELDAYTTLACFVACPSLTSTSRSETQLASVRWAVARVLKSNILQCFWETCFFRRIILKTFVLLPDISECLSPAWSSTCAPRSLPCWTFSCKQKWATPLVFQHVHLRCCFLILVSKVQAPFLHHCWVWSCPWLDHVWDL